MGMIRTVLIVAAVSAPACLASAEDDVMAPRYGNTTITHTDRGHEVHMYYKADHTFTGKIVDVGLDVKGTWTVNNGTVCLTYTPPPPTVTNPMCQAVIAHKVGDTWKVGNNTATLVDGIH